MNGDILRIEIAVAVWVEDDHGDVHEYGLKQPFTTGRDIQRRIEAGLPRNSGLIMPIPPGVDLAEAWPRIDPYYEQIKASLVKSVRRVRQP